MPEGNRFEGATENEFRPAEILLRKYADLTREVVRANPDLIFVTAAPLSSLFKAATTTIPIVAVIADSSCPGLCAKHCSTRPTARRLSNWRRWAGYPQSIPSANSSKLEGLWRILLTCWTSIDTSLDRSLRF